MVDALNDKGLLLNRKGHKVSLEEAPLDAGSIALSSNAPLEAAAAFFARHKAEGGTGITTQTVTFVDANFWQRLAIRAVRVFEIEYDEHARELTTYASWQEVVDLARKSGQLKVHVPSNAGPSGTESWK